MELVSNIRKFNTIYIVFCALVILSCKANEKHRENNSNEVTFNFEIRGTIPDISIISTLRNNSNEDLCFLMVDDYDVLSLSVNAITHDTLWGDYNEMFLYMNSYYPPKYYGPIDTSVNVYSLLPLYSEYVEFSDFYYYLLDRFRNINDVDKSTIYQMNLQLFFNSAVFIKANEIRKDTVHLKNLYSRYPDEVLKFRFSYPVELVTYDLDTIKLSKTIDQWEHEFKIVFPKYFDGYRVVCDEFEMSDSIIVGLNRK